MKHKDSFAGFDLWILFLKTVAINALLEPNGGFPVQYSEACDDAVGSAEDDRSDLCRLIGFVEDIDVHKQPIRWRVAPPDGERSESDTRVVGAYPCFDESPRRRVGIQCAPDVLLSYVNGPTAEASKDTQGDDPHEGDEDEYWCVLHIVWSNIRH